MKDFINKCYENKLNNDDIVKALSFEEDNAKILFDIGNKIREIYCGDTVHIRGLVEISNICGRNCKYCGLRRDNSNLKRYKMPIEEIYDLALKMDQENYKTIVMQSGESEAYNKYDFADLIKSIKKNTSMKVTLSLGEKSFETYELWKRAGADRYLLRHETCDSDHYKYLHNEGTLEERIKSLYNLSKLGYETGCGFMVGSPNQKIEYILKDLNFIKEFKPKMVGIGPYIMHKDTPFAGEKNGNIFLTLKILSLVRIITRNAYMPATTALASVGENGYREGLKVGCNVIMVNNTPEKYKALYEIYPNKKCVSENTNTILHEIKNLIKDCGRNYL